MYICMYICIYKQIIYIHIYINIYIYRYVFKNLLMAIAGVHFLNTKQRLECSSTKTVRLPGTKKTPQNNSRPASLPASLARALGL